MAAEKGKDVIVAIKKASTWGTAVECGALDGVLVEEVEITKSHERKEDKSLNASAQQEPDILGAKRYTCRMVLPARYRGGLDLILAALLGDDSLTAINNSDPTQVGSEHEMVAQADNDGIFLTLAVWAKTRNEILELDTFKVESAEIVDAPGDNAVVTMQGIGHRYRRSGHESTTNTTSTMANVTLDTPRDVASFNDYVLKINDQSGGDVSGESAFDDAGYTLRISRSYKNFDPDGTYKPYVREGEDEDFPMVELSITKQAIDDYNDEDDYFNNTAKKASIVYTGPLLTNGDGGQNHRIAFYFPYLEYSPDAPAEGYSGPGIPGQTLTFRGRRPADGSAPTGMDAAVFYAEIDNELQTDLLA